MNRIRETVIVIICLGALVYLGYTIQEIKRLKVMQRITNSRVDSLYHEIFTLKSKNYVPGTASR